MKKLLAIVAIVSLFALGYVRHASAFTETLPPASAIGVVPVSNGYDWSLSSGTAVPPLQLLIKSSTQMNLLTPVGNGSLIYCSDCTLSTLCVSTGPTAGAWVTVSSNTAANTSHCR